MLALRAGKEMCLQRFGVDADDKQVNKSPLASKTIADN